MSSKTLGGFIFILTLSLLPYSAFALDRSAGREVLEPLVHSAEVEIDQKDNRMKATIPAENPETPGRKPNPLYQGAGSIAEGIYYAAKAPVDAVGKGTDLTVAAIQKLSRKTYDWIAAPFRNESNS